MLSLTYDRTTIPSGCAGLQCPGSHPPQDYTLTCRGHKVSENTQVGQWRPGKNQCPRPAGLEKARDHIEEREE